MIKLTMRREEKTKEQERPDKSRSRLYEAHNFVLG
jgi:hypothetical protein